ncbi:MAG TPA: response regulator FixJ [Alphaproteobacteria bacterium]|jgi:two-component system response regulator FixJ|nr:response regulator FixJ [Alphaproteobacteria bacterium]
MAEAETVCVVDDDPGMRDSLSFLLESRGYPVRAFASAQEFLKSDESRGTGCLIADVRMPDMTGLELQERLAQQGSRLRVVIITGHADVAMAVGAMKAGAVDFIEKPFNDDVLVDSVERALEQSRRILTRSENSAELGDRLETLTAREREVLDHLVTGSPHKVIAHALNISPRTIEVHRARIMQKLGARNLADLVRMTMAGGTDRTG